MKATKAIEILHLYTQHLDIAIEPDLVNSMNLGIEALKRTQACRAENCDFSFQLFPGETPEDE